MKLNYWKLLLAGVLYAVTAQIIHTIGALVAMAYYTMPEYFTVWSKLMMPTAGPPPASFYVYSILFSLITGLLLAIVYVVVKESVAGKTKVKKGLMYGFLVFLVGGLPFSLTILLLVNLPFGLICEWAAETLVVNLLGGMVIAWLMK